MSSKLNELLHFMADRERIMQMETTGELAATIFPDFTPEEVEELLQHITSASLDWFLNTGNIEGTLINTFLKGAELGKEMERRGR